MNRPATLAAAIVARLGTQRFSMPFVPERAYAPVVSLEQLKGLKVVVAPLSREVEMADRGDDYDTLEVTVWILKRVAVTTLGEQDQVADLADEIQKFLRRLQIDGFSWVGINHSLAIPHYLQNHNVYGSAITTRYKELVEC